MMEQPENWEEKRADDGIRTCDLRITNALLYQLSYVGLLLMAQT